MLALPPDACERVAKCILLLSSDQPGEVVAAANAIGRTLIAYGATWHELAATAACPPAVKEPWGPSRWPPQPSHSVMFRALLRLPLSSSDRQWIMKLSSFYREHGRLTPRQAEVLEEIYRRHSND